MLKKCAVAVILFLAPVMAQAADWEGVFEGTIGKAKIIVELNAGADKTAYKGGVSDGARYSYVPKARDINLILDAEGETLHFTETLHLHRMYEDEKEKKVTGSWVLKVNAAGADGTWTSPKGDKTFPIHLTRAALVPSADVRSDQSQLTATYDTLWLETVTFDDAGSAKTFGNVEMRWVKDSAFGTRYPVIGKFPDGNRKAKINALLMTKHMQSVSGYRDCFNGVPVDWSEPETEAQFSFTIDYASEHVLSYTEGGSVFCGGAHPSNYVAPMSFDLDEPAQMGGDYQLDLAPQGFGRVLKLSTKEERIAFERFALGRWLDAAKAAGDDGEDGCSKGWIDDEAEGEKNFDLSFAPKGLAVTRTDYPHVASNCLFQDFNPTIIPWSDLKSFLKSGQTLLQEEIR